MPIAIVIAHFLEKFVDSPGKDFSHALNQYMKKESKDSNTLMEFLKGNKFLMSIVAFQVIVYFSV